MIGIEPRLPRTRKLLWNDDIYAFQEAVQNINPADSLYIVGGAVRDAFLHRPIKDLDLTTSGDAIRIARKIANTFSGDIFVMDAERGVARVFLPLPEGTLTVDVTRFRGDDLLADLQGRDFTANAIAVDLRGDLGYMIDPLDGESDLTNKLLRRCSVTSLEEDPVRALRAVRQSVQFGFRLDQGTTQDVRLTAPRLVESSPERIRDEFFSLLSLDRVAAALKVADTLGILTVILPQVWRLHDISLPDTYRQDGWKHTLETVEQLARILKVISYQRTDHTAASFDLGMVAIQLDRFRQSLNQHLAVEWANGRSHRALLLLGALVHTLEEAFPHSGSQMQAAGIADALRLSGPEKKRLVTLVADYPQTQQIDYHAVLELHRFWHSAGPAGIDSCLLGLANYLATYGIQLRQDQWLEQVERAVVLLDAYFTHYNRIVAPEPFLNGSDLMLELGISGGPLIGELLDSLREAQVTGEITSREDALEFIRRGEQ